MFKLMVRKVVGIAALSSACLLTVGGAAFAQSNEPPVAAVVAASTEPGVLIVSVQPDSPAAEAGLSRGDIVLQANGAPINSVPELHAAILSLNVGDTLTLSVQHGDEQRDLEITLGTQNGQPFLGVVPFGGMGDVQVTAGRITTRPRAGADFQWRPAPGFAPELHSQFTVTKTVTLRVIEVLPDSPAAAAGLQAGDVIVAVDGEPLAPEADLLERLSAYEPGETVTLGVERGADPGEMVELTVELGEHPDKVGVAYLGIRLAPSFDHFEMGRAPLMPGRDHTGERQFWFQRPAPFTSVMPPMIMIMPYGYWMGAPGFAAPPFAPQNGGGFLYILPMPAQPPMNFFTTPPWMSAPAVPVAPGVEGMGFEAQPPTFFEAVPAEPVQIQPAPMEIEIVTDEAI